MSYQSRIEDGWVIVEDSATSYVMRVRALAAYADLMGMSNPVDAMDAFVKFRKDRREQRDPTGPHEWTDTFTVLKHLEVLREKEAVRAKMEGTASDPRSPNLRSTLAVREEMDRLANGGDCLLARCQKAARDKLNVPDPDRKPSAVRTAGMACEAEPRTVQEGDKCSEIDPKCREDLATKLAPFTEDLRRERELFRHRLTKNEEDPLANEPAPKPTRPPTISEVVDRY